MALRIRRENSPKRTHLQVVGELRVRGDDHSLAGGVKLRPASASEDLLHVEHADVDERAALRVVHLHKSRPEYGRVMLGTTRSVVRRTPACP